MKKPARILVVDDESGMLRAVERVLGSSHRVLGSHSSAEAVRIAADFRPDLVVLDIRMPELDGFELMTRLKAEHRDLDVILMTGSLDDLDQKLIRAIRGHAFYFIQKPFDREVIQTLVDRCLELRWRREENRRHLERLERELGEARAFQRTLIPAQDAAFDSVSISCSYQPCFELGGDLYDYTPVDPGATALLVADVAGHGVSAAMLTGIVKSAFRASDAESYEPRAVVQRVRDGLSAFGAERFVTLVSVLVDAGGNSLSYVNAGHPAALLCSAAGRLERLGSTGPNTWEQRELPFRPGDRLLLFTDGVLDALAGDDDYGDEPIASAVAAHAGTDRALLDAILDRIRVRLGGRPLPDDVTLLLASRSRTREDIERQAGAARSRPRGAVERAASSRGTSPGPSRRPASRDHSLRSETMGSMDAARRAGR
jgi:sigma-B regulation protein RsbU (phosphoserine phosphatase)